MGIHSPDFRRKRHTKFTQKHNFFQVSKNSKMSESHFDKYEHYNYDQDKAMYSGGSGKQRSKLEAAQHTNQHNPAGHERKIATKLMNSDKNRKDSHGKGPIS